MLLLYTTGVYPFSPFYLLASVVQYTTGVVCRVNELIARYNSILIKSY